MGRDIGLENIARLAESVVAKLKLTGDKFDITDCSICGYPCGFIADKEIGLQYDSGCDCSPGRPYSRRPVHVTEIREYLGQAAYFNKALKFLNRPVTDFLD